MMASLATNTENVKMKCESANGEILSSNRNVRSCLKFIFNPRIQTQGVTYRGCEYGFPICRNYFSKNSKSLNYFISQFVTNGYDQIMARFLFEFIGGTV